MLSLKLAMRMGTKKKSDSNSAIIHGPTVDLWQKGDGIIDKNVIKVAGWNVNGFRSVYTKGVLQSFIDQSKADFVCLNETKIDLECYKKQIQQKKHFQGYHQYWNFCKVSSGYSGVSIYSRFKPITIVEDIPNFTVHSLEGRILALEYSNFYLVNVYKPNAGRILERLQYRTAEYDLAFNTYIKQLQKIKPVIIFGDMNVAHMPIDLAKPKSNESKAGYTKQERESFSNLLSLNLIDTFRSQHPTQVKYTYWSYLQNCKERNIGWRIDYILMDSRLKLITSQIHDNITGSDHCPISAEIDLKI